MPTKPTPPRAAKTPPHISLSMLRESHGWTVAELMMRMQAEAPEFTTTKGHISGIENGHRGASPLMLSVLCKAYGLPDGAITTDYRPLDRRGNNEVAA